MKSPIKNKEAIQLLTEVVTYYIETHEETADMDPTNDRIEEMETHVKKSLNRHTKNAHIKHHTHNRCVDWCPKCNKTATKLKILYA